MSAKIIDGKEISAYIKRQAAERAAACAAAGRAPCLAVILVGDDPASQVYVRNKHLACEACGITSLQYALPAETAQEELLTLIRRLNADESVDGILCQLPLPPHLDAEAVTDAIAPEKDVDGFHPVNVGRLLSDKPCFLPCTPAGIVEMLKYEKIPIEGRRAVVIGRSNIVGKPAAVLLMRENATVTVCHSKTENLSQIVKTADIVVAALKKPRFITGEMLKPGCTVIDVGINRLPDGSLCGDVDFASAKEIAGAITPVPGGVGPMTIAMLMMNTVKSAEARMGMRKG